MNVLNIALELIQPPRLQPRLEEDDPGIKELAASIDRHGLISPLTVVEEDGKYRLLAGNRRLHAHHLLGRTHAECNVIAPNPDIEDEITLAENLLRLNLSPVEEAYAFAIHLNRTGQSHDELADQLGKERTYVTRRLLLLDLDNTTLGALEEGIINLSQALLLRRISDADIRAKFIEHAVEYGANVRVMALWVANYEKEKARAQAEDNRQLEPTAFEPTREVFMGCDRCGEPTSYDTLRPAYLCPPCRKAVASHRALQDLQE
jgi:ParB family chromosome partitioning protein